MCHKLVYEALQSLRFDAYLESIDNKQKESVLTSIQNVADCFANGTLIDCIESQQMEQLVNNYEQFVEKSSMKSKTFAFWSMYIKMTGMYYIPACSSCKPYIIHLSAAQM